MSVSPRKVNLLAPELNGWCELQEYHIAPVEIYDLKCQMVKKCTEKFMSHSALPMHFNL